MSNSEGIPEFQYKHPDGRPRTRIEMDQGLRKEIPKVHWLRIHAARTLGLPKQIAWDMREIVLRHWILDEMIRKQFIVGDLLGVNATSYNDETELRQFTQQLTALIQAGQAIQPQHAEGIDMNYTPPPPPVMGGAPQQTAYAPGPPAPPGPPMGPPGYPAAPPGPPQQQYHPPGPPQQAAPPSYAPPPAGVPMAPPSMQPPPMAPPSVPAGPPAPGPGRRKRGEAAPPQATAPVPSMAPSVPQNFAPANYAQPPQAAPQYTQPVPPPVQFQPPQVQQAPAAPAVDLSVVLQKLDHALGAIQQLTADNRALTRKVELLSMVNTIVCRAVYQKPGVPDAAVFLTELNVPLPQ